MRIEDCFMKNDISEKINTNFRYPSFQFEKIVLSNESEKKIYEGQSNNYYKILKIKNKYMMYYRASNNPYLINGNLNTNPNYHLENVCVAESNDGLNFKKKIIKKNNVIMKKDYCHNFFPNYINNKYLGLSGTSLSNNGLYLFKSDNGINWNKTNKIVNESNILKYFKHKNHFDTHNSLNFNNLDKYYYLHLRHNHFDDTRKVQLIKTLDFKTLLEPKLININNNFNYEIYNLNTIKLNEHKYFMAIPNYAHDIELNTFDNKKFNTKKKFINDLLISNNGVDYKTFIPDIKLSNMNHNGQICPVNGIMKSKDKKKLYFYFQNNVHEDNHEIQCYSIPYNRFIGNYSYKYGYIRTKKLDLKNSNIEVNFTSSSLYKTAYLIVELLDTNKNRLNISKIIKGHGFRKNVNWMYNEDLSNKNKYIIKFHLYNICLYGFNYEIKNNFKLDFIWSKGIFDRKDYYLKNTKCKPDENVVLTQMKKNNGYIWIRNSLKKYDIRDLDYFAMNLNKLKKTTILVVGDGDDPIPSSYSMDTIKKILDCKLIKKVLVQNYDKSFSHIKLDYYPIGLDLHTPKFLLDFNHDEKIAYIKSIRNFEQNYILDKIFCDTHLSNTHEDRTIMYDKIKMNKNIVFLNERLDFKKILKEYRKYKFVLSPRGNGLDCHRTWELFLLGCIVIMKTSSLDEMWIKNKLPVVIIEDYDDLNKLSLKKLLNWFEKLNHYTFTENIYPKFKNSYWLNNF